MALNIKYEKATYQAKITQLEGLHAQLALHLTNMEKLKEQLFNFWEDEKARKTGETLLKEITIVKTTMTQAQTEISVLKGTVEKYSGLESKQEQQLDTVFRALEVAAEYIPG